MPLTFDLCDAEMKIISYKKQLSIIIEWEGGGYRLSNDLNINTTVAFIKAQ